MLSQGLVSVVSVYMLSSLVCCVTYLIGTSGQVDFLNK